MKESVLKYIDDNKTVFVDQLKDWLKIASISADSNFAGEVKKAAEFVAKDLKSIGFDTEIIKTEGHPLVYAEWMKAPGKPTILYYGHYDVQPVDPLEEWKSPPFEPTERNGNLYARGATDDKGQFYTHVKAVEAWLKTEKSLPVNVKFIIEGEEESGGTSLYTYIVENKEKLKCDFVVVSDSSQFAPGKPAITYGLKGIVALEFLLKGPSQDLHSGTFGGAVANPGNNLCKIIAAAHDDKGVIQIPGFLDDVVPLADWERKQFADLKFDEKEFCKSLNISTAYGEEGYTALERKWARPTCDINGITCGYQGEGSKTIIPAKASAKFSCRLVPNHEPKKILAPLKEFVTKNLNPGITVEFIGEHAAPPVAVTVESAAVKSAIKAIEKGFGKAPVFIREGGSIPIVGSFKENLGADTLLLGWGQNDDNLHSPNEKFSLSDFQKGIITSACLLYESSL